LSGGGGEAVKAGHAIKRIVVAFEADLSVLRSNKEAGLSKGRSN
jgi:hypothetical protein